MTPVVPRPGLFSHITSAVGRAAETAVKAVKDGSSTLLTKIQSVWAGFVALMKAGANKFVSLCGRAGTAIAGLPLWGKLLLVLAVIAGGSGIAYISIRRATTPQPQAQ